jgi:hypothetical protein
MPRAEKMNMFPRGNMPHPALVRSVAESRQAVFSGGNIRSAA